MENKKNKGKIPLAVYFIFFFGMLIILNMFRTSYNVKEITYSEFKDMIDAKQIEEITIGNDTIDLVVDSLINNSESGNEFYKMLKKLKEEEKYQLIKDSLDPYDKNLIVTPKDIDETIENLAIIISEGLNRSLHPGRI